MTTGTLTHGISKRIREIQFGLLSPDEIRKMSATKIITADTYDDDGFPIEMGLMDSHLGVIEPGLRCKTCGGKVDDCPGHFGHIDLAIPIIHVGFVKDVQRLLESTCKNCGRILLTDDRTAEYKTIIEDAKNFGADTLDVSLINKNVAREAKASAVCPHCNTEQSKITLDKPSTFREEGHKLTPKDVRTRLEKIQD